MRSASILVLLAACAPQLDLPATDWTPPEAPDNALEGLLPAPGSLTLTLDQLRAEAPTTFTVAGATPGDTATVVYGTPGPGPCPPELAGACLDVTSPSVVGSALVGAGGTATIVAAVPGAAPAGAPFWFQAATTGVQADTSSVVADIVTGCGDWVVQGGEGEDCDDGNRIDGDGCSASCLLEAGGAETFTYERRKIDVLFLVDNSCSMAEEQGSLTAAFPLVVTELWATQTDFHIGVISTDMASGSHSGRLREVAGVRYIEPDTPNAVATFTTMAMMGTSGSGDERGREAIYTALGPLGNSYNAGFYRPAAQLGVVALSDEDDHSTNNPISKAEFIAVALAAKADPLDVEFHSIVTPPSCSCGPLQDERPGFAYLDYTAGIGGTAHDIRVADYSPALQAVLDGFDTSAPVVTLSGAPDPATLVVTVTEPGGGVVVAVQGVDYTWDGVANAVVFDLGYVPETGAVVEVAYGF